eukprot:gene23842-30117_t
MLEKHVRSQHKRGADVLWAMVTCVEQKSPEPEVVEVFPQKRPRTVVDLSDEPTFVCHFSAFPYNWQLRDIIIVTSHEGKYCGTFNEFKQRHGKGTMTYSVGPFAGGVFKGDWVNDKRQGPGKVDLSCVVDRKRVSTEFYCTWVDDKCHGPSRRVTYDDRLREDGHFQGMISELFLCNYTNGVMDEQVTLRLACGDTYSGVWRDGKKEGFGILYTEADKSTFHGSFKNDKKEGTGYLAFPNGDYHTGEWSNDMKNGKGECSQNGIVHCKGDWINGLKDGLFGVCIKDKNVTYEIYKNGVLMRKSDQYPR